MFASFDNPISRCKSLYMATQPALWSCIELAQFFLAVSLPDLGTPSNISTLFLSVVPSTYVATESILLPSASFNPFILNLIFHSRYFLDEVPCPSTNRLVSVKLRSGLSLKNTSRLPATPEGFNRFGNGLSTTNTLYNNLVALKSIFTPSPSSTWLRAFSFCFSSVVTNWLI